MKKCCICERKESEIEIEEIPQAKGDKRKLVHYDYAKGPVEICLACRYMLGNGWSAHPKLGQWYNVKKKVKK